ncbi:hypothetical protein E2P81_ATG09761 [Venturia nashicola]|nr:hypothetical protein E2P81_ATG09761 [Venturia nashicola]
MPTIKLLVGNSSKIVAKPAPVCINLIFTFSKAAVRSRSWYSGTSAPDPVPMLEPLVSGCRRPIRMRWPKPMRCLITTSMAAATVAMTDGTMTAPIELEETDTVALTEHNMTQKTREQRAEKLKPAKGLEATAKWNAERQAKLGA